jgi:hypothetical protein
LIIGKKYAFNRAISEPPQSASKNTVLPVAEDFEDSSSEDLERRERRRFLEPVAEEEPHHKNSKVNESKNGGVPPL